MSEVCKAIEVRKAIEADVNKLIGEQLGVGIASIKPDSDLFSDLGADSLDAVELVMCLEDYYRIEIDDQTAEGFKTPAQIADYIEKLEKP